MSSTDPPFLARSIASLKTVSLLIPSASILNSFLVPSATVLASVTTPERLDILELNELFHGRRSRFQVEAKLKELRYEEAELRAAKEKWLAPLAQNGLGAPLADDMGQQVPQVNHSI